MATSQQPQGTALAISERGQAPAVQAETSSSAVAAREKAAVEARFLMALHRPRNPDLARQRLLLRCENPRFAAVAEYSKPVGGGKRATGASIRLMEEIGRQYGNVDVQSTVTFDDHERRIINVSATDLETNYSQSVDVIIAKTVERRSPRDGDEVLGKRTNSNGQTVYKIVADEDAFLTKQNASIAKARREVLRAVVPGDLTDEALEVASATRRNRDAEDPAGARKAVADAFFRYGVMASQLCDYLDKPSLENITQAELEVLRHIYTGIAEGETTWKEVMEEKRPSAPTGETKPQGKGTAGLKDALKSKAPQADNVKPETTVDDSAQAQADKLIRHYGSATKTLKGTDIRHLRDDVLEVLNERAEAERTD